MKNIKLLNIGKIAFSAFCLSAVSSFGALSYDLRSDASGFTGAGVSWSGAGTITPGLIGFSGVDPVTIITGATTGSLSLGEAFPVGTTLERTTTATMNLDFGAGSGDLGVTSHQFPNALNFNVTNITGTNSFSIEFIFSEPLAASHVPGFADNGPFLAGYGGGLTSNKVATVSYSGLTHSLDGGLTFSSGLPATAQADNNNFGSSLVFPAGSAVGTESGTNFNPTGGTSWSGINGFDLDDGNLELSEQPDVYATGIKIEFTAAAGFAAGETFNFSTNGTQFNNIDNIPEPTAGVLGLIAGLSFLSVRRRK